MDTYLKEYVVRDGQEYKIELYYSLGGYNHFTGDYEGRGYYLSVSPISTTRDELGKVIWTSYTAFTGVKKLLKEVKRKSNKAKEEALSLAQKEKDALLDYVHNKNAS